MRPIRATASSARSFSWTESESTRPVQYTAVSFTHHIFKDVLETLSFGSKTRVTSNKRAVQYMPKLSEPKKSD
jgi:hypothetical protein